MFPSPSLDRYQSTPLRQGPSGHGLHNRTDLSYIVYAQNTAQSLSSALFAPIISGQGPMVSDLGSIACSVAFSRQEIPVVKIYGSGCVNKAVILRIYFQFFTVVSGKIITFAT